MQDEALLVNWKLQLERDVQMLKVKTNLRRIETVSFCFRYHGWPFFVDFFQKYLYRKSAKIIFHIEINPRICISIENLITNKEQW